MLEIVNRTPWVVALIPFTTTFGIDHAGVVIKGTWDIGERELTRCEAQHPIAHSDVRNGDAADGSVRYAADLGWPKGCTDVVLVGHAHTRDARARQIDVGLRVGSLRKVVRVFGERVWYGSSLSWLISEPRPFERMPLVYERAYGGRDSSHKEPSRHAWEPRNPVGTGFAENLVRERLDGLALPNLEDPRKLITTPKDRPKPAGFGFIEGSWVPRSSYAGTYDAAWQAQRAPLLPMDFDPRFFNAATPDLITQEHLVGGEEVAIANADESGLMRFVLPKNRLVVTAEVKERTVHAEPKLDTVWIDTDARQLVMVWRAAIPCPRSFLGIRVVFIKEQSS